MLVNTWKIILIADFEVKELEEQEYHSKWKIIEEKERKKILTEDEHLRKIVEGREKSYIMRLFTNNN